MMCFIGVARANAPNSEHVGGWRLSFDWHQNTALALEPTHVNFYFQIVSKMDGLSLLGMVAEQRLGEAGPRKAVVVGGAKQQVIMVRKDIVVKPEDIKVELQETEDNSMNVDDEEMLGEFESSTSNIIMKCEAEDTEASRAVAETLKLANKHFEKSSQGVATHLNISEFGQFTYKVMENQLCKYSKYTGWHLQRSTGMMKIKLSFKNLQVRGPMMVRALMVRKDETYRHFGVDRICENHRKEASWESREHVLQAAPGLEGMWRYGASGPRRSICFMIGSPHSETGDLEETIGLKCICNDSCSTCDDQTFKQTESSRDLLLVLTLESLDYGIILARRHFGVWPKAVVRPKDLNKTERRKPKGGAAKLNKMREALELERQGAAAAAQAPPPVAAPLPKMKVPFGNGQVFKIAPKFPVLTSRVSPSSISGKQTFNILLPVESKNGIPTTQELMDTTIGLAIKNARTLSISKEEFMKRMEERWSEGEIKKEPPVSQAPPFKEG